MLKLSKVLMCRFHYDYIKNKYASKSELLFTDSDRMYKIKTGDVYQTFLSDIEMLISVIVQLSQITAMIQTN